MKKTKRVLCLLLALAMLVLPLWSCDGDGGDDVDGGGLNDDGSVNWDEVDFKGASLKYAISVKKTIGEGTFKPAMEYLRGPDDTATTDEVLKKVIARNEKVENDLGLSVEYLEVDADDVRDDIKTRVLGSATDAPDVYNNDMSPLNFSIPEGYLTNVLNPIDKNGNEMTSYFDFTNEAWSYGFMSECTLDKSKVYILAGDYNIDLIRMAYVLFVNKTMFNQNAEALGF